MSGPLCPACDLPFTAAELPVRDCCGVRACADCHADGYCCEVAETESMRRRADSQREHDRRLEAIRREMWLQRVAVEALWRTRLAVAYAEVAAGARPAIYADLGKLREAVLA